MTRWQALSASGLRVNEGPRTRNGCREGLSPMERVNVREQKGPAPLSQEGIGVKKLPRRAGTPDRRMTQKGNGGRDPIPGGAAH